MPVLYFLIFGFDYLFGFTCVIHSLRIVDKWHVSELLMSMYEKNLIKRVTVRLDEPLARFIYSASRMTGQTPSEWVRMVLHSYMATVHGASELVRTAKATIENENKATYKHRFF